MEILPYILCIDTGTELCSVALCHGGEILAEIVDRVGDRRHAALLPLLIEQVRQQAEIPLLSVDAICCSMGPGSYTGLRVGLSTAKGLCMALNKPLIGVSTLEALTYSISIGAMDPLSRVISMIAAGRSEVYHGVYNHDHLLTSPISPVILHQDSFNELLASGNALYLVGDGIRVARSLLIPHANLHYGSDEMVASNLCFPGLKKYIQGNFENIAYSVPEYIKAPNYKKYV